MCPPGRRLAWAFAGVSGKKGQRNGDIGCERQPVTLFFQVRPEECDGNSYTIEHATPDASAASMNVKNAQSPREIAAHLPARIAASGRWLRRVGEVSRRCQLHRRAPHRS